MPTLPSINQYDQYFPVTYQQRVYGDEYTVFRNGSGTSGVFKAKYRGRCSDCGNDVYANESAQYLYNQFGHPIGAEVGTRYLRTCQIKMQEVSINVGGCSVSDINARIKATETALSELYAKQEAIKAFGKDADYPDGAVLLYKPYGGYWRSAVKASSNCWHLRVSAPGGYGGISTSWDRLVEGYLVEANEVWFGTSVGSAEVNKLVKLPDLHDGHTCFMNPREVVAVTESAVQERDVDGRIVNIPVTVIYTTSGGAFKIKCSTAVEIIRKLGL